MTNLQVDSSGSLPPPGRVPRTDVAALAALSVGGNNPLDPNNSYTLAGKLANHYFRMFVLVARKKLTHTHFLRNYYLQSGRWEI